MYNTIHSSMNNLWVNDICMQMHELLENHQITYRKERDNVPNQK